VLILSDVEGRNGKNGTAHHLFCQMSRVEMEMNGTAHQLFRQGSRVETEKNGTAHHPNQL